MKIFKKIFLNSIVVILIVILISAYICNIFFKSDYDYYSDRTYRNEIAGTLDYLFIGSSEGMCAFIPNIIDKKLNVNSYNLSGSQISPNGKMAIVKEEVERNKIDKVVIITGDDLDYSTYMQRSEGELYLIPRLNEKFGNFFYFIKNVCIRDYLTLYSLYMHNGLEVGLNELVGENQSRFDESKKGYYEKECNDVKLNDDDITKLYKKNSDYSINSLNVSKLKDLINYLIENNIEPILVTPVYSEKRIWEGNPSDEILNIYKSIADDCNCKYYDFNLYKDRKNLISDNFSFSDESHMCGFGAEVFTNLFCDVMKKVEAGEDVSDMFYDSYEEAITHFDYYERYMELTKGQ